MLPDKPDAVKNVSDRLWEAALDEADKNWKQYGSYPQLTKRTVDHARCLIMLKEVEEPRDPLDEAIEAAWDEFRKSSADRLIGTETLFYRAIRLHLGPFLKGEG